MALDHVFRPLAWPIARPRTPAKEKVKATFKADWSNTMAMLEREIGKLGAASCIIQIDVPESQIRVDGQIRAQAAVKSSAVIVNFTADQLGPMMLPADRLTDWRHNVRAVAYHLEHLRMASLYGVGLKGEQYRGWKQLPDQSLLTPAMTVEQAAHLISADAGGNSATANKILGDFDTYREMYRRAAGRAHPDRGGDPRVWNSLQEAKRVLDAHHNGAMQ